MSNEENEAEETCSTTPVSSTSTAATTTTATTTAAVITSSHIVSDSLVVDQTGGSSDDSTQSKMPLTTAANNTTDTTNTLSDNGNPRSDSPENTETLMQPTITPTAVTPPAPPEDLVVVATAVSEEPPPVSVAFKVVYSSKKYDVELPITHTIRQLKQHLHPIIDVVPRMQKVMIKGLAGDDKTLQELAVSKSSKVLVVGSKFDEVMQLNAPAASRAGTSTNVRSEATRGRSTSVLSDALSNSQQHKKIIDKGPPDDAHPGIIGKKEPLPPHPLSGMLTKSGGKVRLTFKLELDQIWIGTKQRTEKVNMSSVRTVVSEPIQGHECYHIMGIQLGPTEASRYWLYWVPAQYVTAIKNTVMGGGLW